MANKIQLRRDTAGNWTNTIVLSQGEIGVEWDTGRFKLGDGTSNWGQLDYFEPGAGGGAGGGLSISDFGLGFTDALDAGKITTSKLYNENPNPGLNNQYTLEVTNGGVVALPDGSIINGATLKSVAGNYAGITAGPAGHDEDSWMWVDSDGAWISTDSSDNNHTWKFQNDGKFILPVGGDIVASDGVTSVLGGGGSSSSLVNGSHTVSLGSDGKLTVPGEIKSQAGVGDVVIEANNGTAKTWTFAGNGYLNLPGGTAFIVAEGNAVSIGANGEPGSSSLDLTSLGAGLTSQVDLRLSAGGGAQHWEFGTDGALTLPSGASISNVTTGFNQTFTENGSGGSSTNQDSLTVGIGDPAWAAAIAANPGNYYIRFASEDYLGQSTIGAISGPAPGTNVYTLTGSWSADGGGFPIIITSNDYVSVTDINSNSGARITTDGGSWTFDTYGVLTLPGVPSPNFFGDHGTISYRPSEWQAVQTVGSTIPGVNGVGGGGTWKFNKTLYEFDFTAIKPGDTLMLDNADVGYSDPPGTRGYAAGITVSYQDPDNQDLWIIGSSQAGPNLPDGTTMWLKYNDESISLNDAWGFSNSSLNLPYNAKFKRNENEWTFGDDGTLELPASLKIGPISDIPTIYSTGSNLVVGSYNDLILSAEDGDYDWTFGQDGSLTFPSGAGFGLGEGGQLKVHDGNTLSLDFRDQSGRGFYTNGDGYTIRSNGTYNWIFSSDGSLTVPGIIKKDDALQLTSAGALTTNTASVNVYGDLGKVLLRTDNGTSSKDWQFNVDGSMEFPDSTVQTTAYPAGKLQQYNTVFAGPESSITYLFAGPAFYGLGWVSNGDASVDQYVAPQVVTGITPSYILTGNNASHSRNLEQDFTYKTIEFWFMPNGGNAWLAFGTDSGGGGGMVLSLKSGTSSQNGLSDSQNFLYGDYGSVTNTFTEGTWYNIKIVTYDIGETPEWYVDDVLIEGDTALNYTLGSGTWFGIIHDGSGYCHFDNIRISLETPGTTPTFRSLVAADLPDISTLSNNGHTVSLSSDGTLTLPDTLSIKDSVIGRRVETVNGEAVDAIGSKLTLTDNTIAIEAYNDPDGANNKQSGRMVATTSTVSMSATQEVVSGTIGSWLAITGGGLEFTTSDGTLDSTWAFNVGGGTSVPEDIIFANNRSISVTNTISNLEDIYIGLQAQLNDQFYSLLYGGAGYPWGITVPLTWNSYDEFLALSPDTIPGEGVQINITVLANNTKQAYLTWQESFADTKITVDVNGGFVFAADNSLTFPNAAIIRESTNTEVTTAKTAYTRAIATWEYSRITDYLATVNAGLATLQGHPFAGWDDVSGTTAQAYLDIVNNAWNVQNAPSSPPQQLIFVPPITASLRSQLRSQLQSVINTYATYQTLSTSVDIVAGSEKISLLGNNKIEVPGIVQTTPEEDIVIRTRYAGASSPPGTAIYTNQDFTFGTNGTLTFPDNTIQTTAYQKVSVPIHSYGATGDKVGMVAFDGDYIYYCKQNYVNNSTDIWVRVAWTGTSW
jgi:hypothetical protein